MKRTIVILFAITVLVTSVFSQYNSNKQPVLLELFTSESCFACPPAEELLKKFETEQPFESVELITLEFHVDYRDGFGRKDIYASPLFTQRQRVYDRKFRTGRIYTPQMVVDGDIAFIGTKLNKAKKAIRKSKDGEKARIKLAIREDRLKINITNLPKHGDATVYLAIAEDGLTTRNRKGKNSANASVVRSLNSLGRILSNEKAFEIDTNFQIQDGWNKENLKLVVFMQENNSRIIRGSERFSLKIINENRKS